MFLIELNAIADQAILDKTEEPSHQLFYKIIHKEALIIFFK